MTQTTSELYDELVNKVRQYEMYISTKTLLNNIKHMENKQQTAVEWLVKMLYSPICNGFINGNSRIIPHDIIEHAKKIEKQEIVKAWDLGRRDIDYPATGYQYYNETYEK